jgi:hypothetical protein
MGTGRSGARSSGHANTPAGVAGPGPASDTALISAARNGREVCLKALLAAGAEKEAKECFVSSDACYYPLAADDPTHGLSGDTRPSSGHLRNHEGYVKALLDARANKDARDNVSTSDACDATLMADDPSHGHVETE